MKFWARGTPWALNIFRIVGIYPIRTRIMTPFVCTRLETRFILLTVLHAAAFTKRSKHCIEKVDTKANIIIISTTPCTLVWHLHGSSIRVIENLVFQICSETQDFRTLRFDDACSATIMNPQKITEGCCPGRIYVHGHSMDTHSLFLCKYTRWPSAHTKHAIAR